MQFVDKDGDTIVTTLGEIKQFANDTNCRHCRADANYFLDMASHFGTPQTIVFCIDCEH